jgi:hypothetical protein
MARTPKTYEDWLALSDEERKEVHFNEWNVYARDGIAIAFMAATRLALQCQKRVQEIQIGTYHGGEYLLQLTVSQEDFRDCPPMLAESFEGFRIVWDRLVTLCHRQMWPARWKAVGERRKGTTSSIFGGRVPASM